jgi:hypothetical protein
MFHTYLRSTLPSPSSSSNDTQQVRVHSAGGQGRQFACLSPRAPCSFPSKILILVCLTLTVSSVAEQMKQRATGGAGRDEGYARPINRCGARIASPFGHSPLSCDAAFSPHASNHENQYYSTVYLYSVPCACVSGIETVTLARTHMVGRGNAHYSTLCWEITTYSVTIEKASYSGPFCLSPGRDFSLIWILDQIFHGRMPILRLL